MAKITQSAGKETLGSFAPKFAHYNDDILFGENWNDSGIDTKTRCIVTLTSLIASGITDGSLNYHLLNAKKNGVSQEEIASIITDIAFYAGWPKAWAAFRLAKEIYKDDKPALTALEKYQQTLLFPIGAKNDAFAMYFSGQSYLYPVSTSQIPIYNVTFEPRCRNNWHIHKAQSGGGQILICIGGRGYYQEEGKEAVEMTPGKIVNIPSNTKHWHGAASDSFFSHLAIEVPGVETANVWLDKVSDEDYDNLE